MNQWKCPKCGLGFDRSSDWQMSQIEGHLDRHETGEKN